MWRRRRPRWLAIEKVNVQNLWRASQNSFRWWASTERTEATLDMISSSYKVNVMTVTSYLSPLHLTTCIP